MSTDDDGTAEQPSEPAVEDGIPPAPVPRESELWLNPPFAVDPIFRGGVAESGRYSIGWQNWPEKKGGPGYVIIRRGALGVLKAANRYPLTDEGWAQAWQKLTELDPAAAGRVRDVLVQRTNAPAQPASAPEPPAPANALAPPPAPRREKEAWSVRVANTFTGLGVRVRDGDVYPYPTLGQQALGPVAGARAEITDPTKAQMVRAGVASGMALGAVLGPLALAPGLFRKSKAVAFVVCANGRLHEKKLDGNAMIRAAQRDLARFNALAGSAAPPGSTAPPPGHQPPSPPPSPSARERLAEIAALHDEGLLTDEEYQAKRAEIIREL